MSERDKLIRAVQEVTWNASNYPEKMQPHVLGQDIVPLTMRIVDAVEAVFEKAHTPTDDESVEWRSVVGHEGMYEVSETGEVRSVARTVQRSNGAEQTVAGKLLTKHPDRRGYHLVSLTRDHKAVHRRVHRLVLEAFVGPCPAGHEGLHGDGDMHNNHRSNLRWGTRTENVHDSMRHGTLPVGEDSAAAKVTEKDVRAIRAAHSAGASIRGLSKKYELALSTTQAIVHRRSWKHVI